jgi:hypothetical protein
MDAFDDVMRDLDNLMDTATGRPPALAYLTNIINAHLLLIDQYAVFPWFASLATYYRDFYRDEADTRAAFAFLLSAPADRLDEVCERWISAGVEVATVLV